jgi:RNA polymerase sigma-70 factor, ECF subfamily
VFRRAGEREPKHLAPDDADRSLVRAAQADPRRFEPLYRKYVGQVYSFALYELRDRPAAEDLTEQVFLRALAGLPRFQERGEDEASTFRVWLFQIARHAVSNHRRLLLRRPEAPLDLALELPAPDDVARAVEERDLARRALRAVMALPDDRREVILLRYVEEMATEEVALVLGRSEAAVRVLLHRALRAVARELQGRDAAS